ncbi:DMT family transporter [Pseudoruegeria sp. SHC-113]|uniref:DMT family transporter n=1 Tax=Pseudoruegeria sp. SHC-113 TaxID=2855439 RepID=UPI0021BAAF85|nr:DMT family transporter [Pseudoruegeria sp. SHC-113]MCT8160947.1 DMT family transporter [Pseudoruegeria sp. SHC-113]
MTLHAKVEPIPGRTPVFLAPLLLLSVGALLALSIVVAAQAVASGGQALPFLTAASALSAGILLGVVWLRALPARVDARVLEYGLVAGGLFALPNALGFLAVRHVGVGFYALSFAFPILATYAIALLLTMERFSPQRFMAVLLGVAGAALLAAGKLAPDPTGGSREALWVAITLALPLVIALGNIYRTRRWPEGRAPIFLAAAMLAGAAFWVGLFLLLAPAARAPSAMPLAWLAAETAIFSVLYVLYFLLQRMAGPVYLSQIGSVAAVMGAGIAILILGEAPPANLAVAATLIAAGVFLFQSAARKRAGA